MDTNGQEMVVRQEPASIAALGTEPTEVIERASRIAHTLAAIVKQAKLVVKISQRDYVMAEGWTTLGAMLSVFPQVEWTRRVDLGNGYAWESRVTLVKADGRTIASAEAMAASNEGAKWCGKEFSIRSMSQTRATGKAYRLAFSWIMTLAGFEPTPAEEMAAFDETRPRSAGRAGSARKDSKDAAATVATRHPAKSRGFLFEVFRSANAVPGLSQVDLTAHTEEAAAARASLCSQVLGVEVKDVSELTFEQMGEAGKRIMETFGVKLPEKETA